MAHGPLAGLAKWPRLPTENRGLVASSISKRGTYEFCVTRKKPLQHARRTNAILIRRKSQALGSVCRNLQLVRTTVVVRTTVAVRSRTESSKTDSVSRSAVMSNRLAETSTRLAAKSKWAVRRIRRMSHRYNHHHVIDIR